jgi:hypothetical protein
MEKTFYFFLMKLVEEGGVTVLILQVNLLKPENGGHTEIASFFCPESSLLLAFITLPHMASTHTQLPKTICYR